MSIRKRDEFWPFEILDSFFDDFWKPSDLRLLRLPRIQFPRMDITENESSYTITADVPGYSKDDINIELKNDLLTISSEIKEEKEEKKEGYILKERTQRSFRRSIRIPEGITPEDISAELTNGILTLRLPKKVPQAPQKIEIKSEEKKEEESTSENE